MNISGRKCDLARRLQVDHAHPWRSLLFCAIVSAEMAQPAAPSPTPATISATRDIDQLLHSTVLNEDRPIRVRLPRNYSSDATTHYPVLFKLENEDGLVRYDNLIVVLIPNARGQRNRDMTVSGRSIAGEYSSWKTDRP